MHLLLVEDDERLAKAVQRIFTAEGHVVDWVADGEDALVQARSSRTTCTCWTYHPPSTGSRLRAGCGRGTTAPILCDGRDSVRTG